MSMPTAVFLDTSVLAGQQYNFSSTALSTFIPACKKRGLRLLLPDPTEREVRRQIQERSREALDALEEARRRAPFLAKWKSFPQRTGAPLENWEVRRVATEEWNAFLKQFDVVRLGYDQLDMITVMNWYDSIAAPFREGKKRKEFPDAFSLAILDAYANANGCYVAIVAEDTDFKLACDRFPCLLHFKSLPRLTELLLAEDDRVSKLHNCIEQGTAQLESAVDAELENVSFYHSDRRFTIDETSLPGCTITDIRVVAIGDHECTVTFEAEFEAEHRLKWEQWASPEDEWPERPSSWVSELAAITGTAKASFNSDSSKLTALTYVSLDALEIEVDSQPRNYW